MKGLIIKEPWIDHILDDEKAWEIRGRGTKIRGTIALIKSGTGLVLGLVDVVDSLELTPDAFYQAEAQHRIPNPATRPLPYPRIYAWVLAHPKRLLVPQPYVHPQGAIIWVNLPEDMDLTRAV
ncbi:MAG: hypothetical protein M1272_07775 [Firmicutes bacterium]|nr:hypothetical protein [Bacillota bacterium]